MQILQLLLSLKYKIYKHLRQLAKSGIFADFLRPIIQFVRVVHEKKYAKSSYKNSYKKFTSDNQEGNEGKHAFAPN
jgi:hypothetical protein